MFKALRILFLLVLLVFLAAFSIQTESNRGEAISLYFEKQLDLFGSSLQVLREKAEADNPSSKELQSLFLATRKEFKKIEFILEYYYELDLKQINGPAIDYYEEEDPSTFYRPMGLQCIETILYPEFDKTSRDRLLNYIDALIVLAQGLKENSRQFDPGTYLYDAIMEELYRIISLGLADTDSPLARLSIPETKAALEGVRFALKTVNPGTDSSYQRLLDKLTSSINYLDSHLIRDQFNTLEFITLYLNPCTELLSRLQTPGKFEVNLFRASALRKNGNLFSIANLNLQVFLGDEKITQEKILLGKELFSEPALSSTGNRSCASCHQSQFAFSDGLAKASDLSGHGSLRRNTPGLWNAALQKNFFHDSRQSTLRDLIREVLSNEKEMNVGVEAAANAVLNNKHYQQLFKNAFPFSNEKSLSSQMVDAMAIYLYSLISYQSRFDDYMRNPGSQLSPDEKKGFNLFMGKARCGTCHFAPFFNGSKPPLYLYQESEVLGVPELKNQKQSRIDPDSGRIISTGRSFHLYSFKTPSVRNIGLTAPYMHNGVFSSLEEVLEFYENGGGKAVGIAPAHQTLPFDKLNLTKKEKRDLLAFLGSLTDTSGLAVKQLIQLPVVD